LSIVQGARIGGARQIIAIDMFPQKEEMAKRAGATHFVNSAEDDPVKAIRRLTGGAGVDHAFEVVGRGETIRIAWDALRPGGSAVVVGLAPRGVDVSVPAIEFLSDKSLRGCFYGSGHVAAELPGLAELALAGRIDLASAVSQLSPLDGVQEALDRLRRGEGARTVLVLDEDLAGVQASQAA
jgi:S-(hydroxymethyl)glutathione dehydrogenase/alcohol dehydrogenase